MQKDSNGLDSNELNYSSALTAVQRAIRMITLAGISTTRVAGLPVHGAVTEQCHLTNLTVASWGLSRRIARVLRATSYWKWGWERNLFRLQVFVVVFYEVKRGASSLFERLRDALLLHGKPSPSGRLSSLPLSLDPEAAGKLR